MTNDEIRAHLRFTTDNLFGDGTAGAPYGRLRTLVVKAERAIDAIAHAAAAIEKHYEREPK